MSKSLHSRLSHRCFRTHFLQPISNQCSMLGHLLPGLLDCISTQSGQLDPLAAHPRVGSIPLDGTLIWELWVIPCHLSVCSEARSKVKKEKKPYANSPAFVHSASSFPVQPSFISDAFARVLAGQRVLLPFWVSKPCLSLIALGAWNSLHFLYMNLFII